MRAKDLPVTTGGATSDKVMKINASGTLENISIANLSTLIGVNSAVTKYVALLNQSAASAPVETILENTLGATISYTYSSGGEYTISASSAIFVASKTVIFIGAPNQQRQYFIIQPINTSSFSLQTIDFDDLQADGMLTNTPIQIIIYP